MTTLQELPRYQDSDEAPKSAAFLDGDIHPTVPPQRLAEHLSEPWRTRLLKYGSSAPSPPEIYPRLRNGGFRLDARVDGGPLGSSLQLLQQQLLDLYGIRYGVLIPLQGHSFGADDTEYSAALCRALNECIAADWLDQDPRLRSSLCVPYDSPEAAAAEIRHWAHDHRFNQVLFPMTGSAAFGHQNYWPIYAAAAEAGLPIAAHVGGMEQHRGAGWPSFYLEEHVWSGNLMSALATSLVCSGVFDRLPDLQVVLVEGAIGWAPSLLWAMDAGWAQLREDLPHLRKPPSDYFREHFWFTTQPIEEPDSPEDFAYLLDATGLSDRIVFASDYPHWDFDSPTTGLRHLPKQLRQKILFDNAPRLYGPTAQGRTQ
jgi:uncharacterized protein